MWLVQVVLREAGAGLLVHWALWHAVHSPGEPDDGKLLWRAGEWLVRDSQEGLANDGDRLVGGTELDGQQLAGEPDDRAIAGGEL